MRIGASESFTLNFGGNFEKKFFLKSTVTIILSFSTPNLNRQTTLHHCCHKSSIHLGYHSYGYNQMECAAVNEQRFQSCLHIDLPRLNIYR